MNSDYVENLDDFAKNSIMYEDAPSKCAVGGEIRAESESSKAVSGGLQVSDIVRRELELIKKENELLVREKEFLEKQMKNLSINTERKENVTTTNINLIKDLIMDFTGSEGEFENWRAQIETVKVTYLIPDDQMKIVIIGKLKLKALLWFRSRAENMTLNLKELLDEMQTLFGGVTNRIVLRRKFEGRRWKVGESFFDYFHSKVEFGNKLGIDEEELIEYLIEGINNISIRNQAKMQKFKNIRELLETMNSIEIGNEKSENSLKKAENKEKYISKNDPRGTKCYNCAKYGHWSKDCRNPKREWGTCYKCGERGHKAEECRRNKPQFGAEKEQKHTVGKIEPDFRVFVKLSGISNVSTEAIVDSGSPFSLIRRSAADDLIITPDRSNTGLVGINGSPVQIIGVAESQYLEVEGQKLNLDLLVVDDKTMKDPILLGRDFINHPQIEVHLYKRKVLVGEKGKPLIDLLIGHDEFEKQFGNVGYTQELSNKEYEEEFDFDFENNDNNFYYCNNEFDVLDVNEVKNENLIIECLKFDGLELEDELNINVQNKIHEMFENYLTCLKLNNEENPIDYKMKITLKKHEPFAFKPRRLSYFEKEKLSEIINDLLEKKIIRHSSSPYSSAIVLVKKKTGELRMCVDYRHLNKLTAKEHFPIPLIEDYLQALSGKRFFTSLDLKSAFHNVVLDEDSIKYTSFVTPTGQYEFCRMPFGLANAPSVFQRYISQIFRNLLEQGKVMIYFDDIFFGSDNMEEHLNILKEVLDILARHKLELRLDKCHVGKTKIEYLGYEISTNGISPNRKNLSAILEYPIPRNIREVQSFLGMCSYFRKFIQNFSILAKPLYDLLRKNVKFEFNEDCLKSYEILKDKLVQKPVLALYSPQDETELHCDASSLGFGAILMQKKSDGKMHPVFFFSKRTTPTEAKYHSFELETLAIIYALQRFRIYLQGRHFRIMTDCNSLMLTLKKKDINPRIARWALELENYDYDIVHRESSRMRHVDALSRSNNILILEENSLEQSLAVHQNKDEIIENIRKTLENQERKDYELRNGLVYRKTQDGRLLFYVPRKLLDNIIRTCHDNMGHLGVDKTTQSFLKNYWYPNVKHKIKEYISKCLKCITFQPVSGRQEGFLHSIPKGIYPFETLHIDHFGPLGRTKGKNKFVFVIIDSFSRFVRLYSTKTTNSKEAIESLENYFRSYSRPVRIISDRGSAFTSNEFQEFCSRLNIKHILVATAAPQANGAVERVNRTIKPIISKLVSKEEGLDWDDVLVDTEFAVNNSENRSTGFSPSKLVFGVTQRGRIVDDLAENLVDLLGRNSEEEDNVRRKNHLDELEKIRKTGENKNNLVQEYNRNRYNLRHKKSHEYKVGDLVTIVNIDTTIGVNKKLIPKYRGPYQVIKALGNDRYLLEDPPGYQNSSRPFKGVYSAQNMKMYLANENN